MNATRREFLHSAGALAVAGLAGAQEPQALPIIDTHQHLWDVTRFRLPWHQDAPEILRRNYRTEEYREATRGFDVRAVYMEVDVDPMQKVAEVEYIVGVGRGQGSPTIGAVVGGLPASDGFADYVRRIAQNRPFVKGVRQVVHNPGTPAGTCVQPNFLRGVRLLGENNLSFDICIRPTELGDALRLTELCPDTRFILDHCGNADSKAFRRNNDGGERPTHDAMSWRRDIEALSRRQNLICKISGIVARAPRGWTADDLAPIVNHCLDSFGPDRVVFGGDWPVCLLGATFRQWVEALRQIVARRPADEQRKLWSENARRLYRLDA
jgi:L-fuconolactonase